MTNVLVTCGGGFQGLGLVRALLASGGLQSFVCDVHADNPVRYLAHHYLVGPPLADANAYATFLLETTRRERIEFVLPATALDLRILASLRTDLRDLGAIAGVCSQPLLDTLLDKAATRRWLIEAQLPAPESIDPYRHDYSCPLLGKPIAGWGGRGLEMINSREEMESRFVAIDPDAYVWSRLLEHFQEYSADFAIGITGGVSPIVVRRRTRTSGGFAIVSESVRNPVLNALFLDLANTLAQSDGRGCFNAQVIVPQSRQVAPFISDVNPRIGTSATHALAEGINLPHWFIQSAHSPALCTPPLRPLVKSVRMLSDLTLPVLAHRPGGVIFDLDDTLVDHKRWLLAKMRALYEARFRDLADGDDYLRTAVQLIDDHEWPHLVDRMLELLGLPSTLRAETIRCYRAIEIPETPLFDDVAPTLSALRQSQLKIAILTDNPPATQKSKIAHAPLLRDVDATVFSQECGGEKPNPAAFAEAVRMLDLPADQLIMVGDNWMRDGAGDRKSTRLNSSH